MAYSISAIRTMIANENARRGFDAPNHGTVGALRLYKDGCGYALDEICNTGGGVRRIYGGGATKAEIGAYLAGISYRA